MIVDGLRRLRAFSPLANYEYVGFGGMEFVDFDLVHRELGITDMTSIEANFRDASRYRFNAPFSCVNMHFDRASAVLPDLLDHARLRVVWLDYECELNLEVLQDLGTALRKLTAGSAFIVSVNAQGPPVAADRLARFTSNVERERVPAEVADASLAKWGWAAACYEVLVAEAEAEVARRYDGVGVRQLFHFHYADGARMLTWGGLLLGQANEPAFDAARFDELPQVRLAGSEPHEISPPVLTTREALHLNDQLPCQSTADLNAEGIGEEELASYAELYRWYPPIPAAM
jgi:hypothetical protein